MADKSEIVWTDASWNAIVGCSKVDDDCRECYAIKSVTRMAGNPDFGERYQGLTRMAANGLQWTGKVAFIEALLERPIRWTRSRMIFVNSLSDLWHPDVPDEWLDRMLAVMAMAPQHTYQALTKRPDRMCKYLSDPNTPERVLRILRDTYHAEPALDGWHWPFPHLWTIASVGFQAPAAERIYWLLRTPSAMHGISAEPLIGALDMTSLPDPIEPDAWRFDALSGGWFLPASEDGYPEQYGDGPTFEGTIKWVIAGGESGGNGARPMHPAWARSLRAQCEAAGVAYLVKQWGEWAPAEREAATHLLHTSGTFMPREEGTQDFPYGESSGRDQDLVDREHPGWVRMRRVGKKAAGRELDGRVHDQYPEPSHLRLSLQPARVEA